MYILTFVALVDGVGFGVCSLLGKLLMTKHIEHCSDCKYIGPRH